MGAYDAFLARCRELHAFDTAIGLMNWDHQVLMPSGGAGARSGAVGELTRMRHVLLVGDDTRRKIEEAATDTKNEVEAANVRVMQRELDQRSKLPTELVTRKASVSSEAYETWKRAKAENNYALLRPYYEELFDIARETAELLGYEENPYDALIDLYEEGAKTADAQRMFDALKGPTKELVDAIRAKGPLDDAPIAKDFDRPTLRQLAQETAAQIGFDFDRGRLDLAPNAFCSGSGPSDVRMTTRASDHLRGILSSTLHEMGHGLYEQNTPRDWEGTPIGDGVSLAVHESQSRLWENIVGRSQGFWRWFSPRLQATFPELSNLSAEELWRMYNKVEPTFIRVGSDELTYNLHIMIRFELEVEIITRKLDLKDLPEAWNAKYTEYLGITPPTDTLGCLQDVHWSRGSAGYFPTYAMGNLIGGAMWARITRELGDVEADFARGDFSRVLGWLREKVYQQGSLKPPRQLVEEVNGQYLDAQPWLDYAREKFSRVYGL